MSHVINHRPVIGWYGHIGPVAAECVNCALYCSKYCALFNFCISDAQYCILLQSVWMPSSLLKTTVRYRELLSLSLSLNRERDVREWVGWRCVPLRPQKLRLKPCRQMFSTASTMVPCHSSRSLRTPVPLTRSTCALLIRYIWYRRMFSTRSICSATQHYSLLLPWRSLYYFSSSHIQLYEVACTYST